MSARPENAPCRRNLGGPTLSDDSLWWWDGQRWQPVAAPRPRRSTGRRVLLIVAIATAVMLELGGIGILGYNALLRLDASSGSGAPLPAAFPSDFPIYHPAALELMSSDGSGATLECDGQWLTTDSLDKILRFYEQKLKVADWEHGPVDRQSLHASMPFRRASDRSYGGVLTLGLNWLNQVGTIEVVMQPHYWKTG